jgi:hypothetical protein
VFLDGVEEELKPTKFSVYFRAVLIVNYERNRKHIKCIPVTDLSSFLHRLENLIFLSDAVVILEVINEVLLAVLPQELKLNALRVGSPLEVE